MWRVRFFTFSPERASPLLFLLFQPLSEYIGAGALGATGLAHSERHLAVDEADGEDGRDTCMEQKIIHRNWLCDQQCSDIIASASSLFLPSDRQMRRACAHAPEK
jgi:hypothetical protein